MGAALCRSAVAARTRFATAGIRTHKQYRLERHIDKVQLYKLWEQQEGKKLLRLKEIITRLNQEKAELEAAKQKVENELLALQLHVITIDPNN